MTAQYGHRYRLVLYTFFIDRLWGYTLGVGLVLLVLAAGLEYLPARMLAFQYTWLTDKALAAIIGVGIYALVLTLLLLIIRNRAYVQPFPNHLLLVTPFLRMNISYRRIRTATSVEMGYLLVKGHYTTWQKKRALPLAAETAIVLDLNGWPIPRAVLAFFLSPFFFPDRSPRLCLLVAKWMDFSTEMESFRSIWLDGLTPPASSPQSDLLASIAKSLK